MKLVFNKSPQGLELAYVECVSTEEADKFQSWFNGKVAAPVEKDDSQPELSLVTPEPVEEAVVEKVSRNDVSQAAIALVQTKGRQALNPILERYNAKRISEIAEDKLSVALAAIRNANK